MSDRPGFTIVIPTRNRGHLLRYALQSALYQTLDDFEIVVSNNCSTDETENVLAEFDSPKIRVVRPDRSLSMPDHWEFALQFARGRYVTYLCDDDALTPDALEKTASVIQETDGTVIMGPYISYFAPTWLEESRRNALLLLRFTGVATVRDSRAALRGIFRCQTSYWTPRMLNSFTRRDVLEKAQQMAGGRLFIFSPDYSFAVIILNATPTWVQMDDPVRVYGVVKEAIGATTSVSRSERPLVQFLSEFEDQSFLQRVPLRLPLTVNYITDAILSAKERLGAAMEDIDIDRAQYYIENWKDIRLLASHGVDTTEDGRAFEQALAAEADDVQQQVTAFSSSSRLTRLRAHLLPSDTWLRRRAYQLRLVGSVLLRGEQWGFTDIVGAARCVSKPPGLGLR